MSPTSRAQCKELVIDLSEIIHQMKSSEMAMTNPMGRRFSQISSKTNLIYKKSIDAMKPDGVLAKTGITIPPDAQASVCLAFQQLVTLQTHLQQNDQRDTATKNHRKKT